MPKPGVTVVQERGSQTGRYLRPRAFIGEVLGTRGGSERWLGYVSTEGRFVVPGGCDEASPATMDLALEVRFGLFVLRATGMHLLLCGITLTVFYCSLQIAHL